MISRVSLPVIESLEPSFGHVTGGADVTVSGSNLEYVIALLLLPMCGHLCENSTQTRFFIPETNFTSQ